MFLYSQGVFGIHAGGPSKVGDPSGTKMASQNRSDRSGASWLATIPLHKSQIIFASLTEKESLAVSNFWG